MMKAEDFPVLLHPILLNKLETLFQNMTYRSHRFGPLSVTALKDFDPFQIVADLYQIADCKLLAVHSLGAGSRRRRCGVHLGKDGRIERPPDVRKRKRLTTLNRRSSSK